MSRLLRTRYLTCFYCGRRSNIPFDRNTRHFECMYCEADNYLDEHGEIADPPVATDKEASPAPQYTVPRATSPEAPSDGNDPIFCNTCLKNQHLLSASLAQYLPDPDDPDYEEAERNLDRFRKTQERLYPQICADCEPKVRQRLEHAAYTAKTDALRRMIDRNSKIRRKVEPSGWLELLDKLGRWLWTSGLVLQLVWHVSVIHAIVSTRPDILLGRPAIKTIVDISNPLIHRLPSAEWLVRWSAYSTVAGVWWNTRFPQVIRGFTKHVSGIRRWYFCQSMAVVLRVALYIAFGPTGIEGERLDDDLGLHALVAGFGILIFITSTTAIHTKVAPLFEPQPQQPLRLYDTPKRPSPKQRPVSSGKGANTPKPDAIKSLVELLDEIDEISRSPTLASPEPPSPTSSPGSTFTRRREAPMGFPHTLAAQQLSSDLQKIDSLNLAGGSSFNTIQRPRPDRVYSAEMDWSPTTGTTAPQQSQYRAFNTQGQRTNQGFGEAPVEPRKGAFWYRVPEAPKTPAEKMRNPMLGKGRLRVSPVVQQQDQRQEIKFRGQDKTQLARETALVTRAEEENGVGVTFAEPSFFAEKIVRTTNDDPRNKLTDLFSGSFKLDEELQQQQEGADKKEGWFGKLVGGNGGSVKKRE
ncbi:integral inner nuclear membrane protein ima1 [Podospora australis]|uniref:Integral inner nuclear membrane protein ima1 n=1 Tax=Podospora australis TaxID=1536484 RepID=A0AAN6WX45_9PEZI|nr:integral inner nuclear membrane protein ima1 [Podospora australis]